MNELDSLVASAQALFAQSATPAELENAKAQFLGKSDRITEPMKGLSALSVEDKKSRGAVINQAKQAIEAALNQRRQALADAELQAQLKAEALDVTLPGRARASGGLHPVSLTLERIEGIKILSVNGLGGPTGGAAVEAGSGLPEQLVNSALRFRAQAPLIDSLLKEIGIEGGNAPGAAQALLAEPQAGEPQA